MPHARPSKRRRTPAQRAVLAVVRDNPGIRAEAIAAQVYVPGYRFDAALAVRPMIEEGDLVEVNGGCYLPGSPKAQKALRTAS
jgi:hypothetical protein